MGRSEKLIADFQFLGTWEERYEYIIDLGKALPEMPDSLKTDSTKVEGCMSQVWITAQEKDGVIVLQGDSDAMIVKGLIAVMFEVFNNAPRTEIQAVDVNALLKSLGLDKNLAGSRRNGLSAMIQRIQSF